MTGEADPGGSLDDALGQEEAAAPTRSPLDEGATELDDMFVDHDTVDIDGDGLTDVQWARLRDGTTVDWTDMDHDGNTEMLSLDRDGDGVPDLIVTRAGDEYELAVDSDFDLREDRTIVATREELAERWPQLLAVIDVAWPPEDGAADQETDGSLVGNPEAMAEQWSLQGFNGACGPASIAQLLRLYTGEDIGRLEVIEATDTAGLLTRGEDGVPGMFIDDIDTMLDSYGLEADVFTNSTIADLEGYLADGHGVLVSVDADEYWTPLLGEGERGINHVVLVTGIDREAGIVYLNDTGTPDGAALEVPLEHFENAWEDGENTMIVVEQSAEEYRDANGIPLDERVVRDDDIEADEPQHGIPDASAENTAEQTPAAPVTTSVDVGARGPLDNVAEFISTRGVVLLPIVLAGAGAAIAGTAVAVTRTK